MEGLVSLWPACAFGLDRPGARVSRQRPRRAGCGRPCPWPVRGRLHACGRRRCRRRRALRPAPGCGPSPRRRRRRPRRRSRRGERPGRPGPRRTGRGTIAPWACPWSERITNRYFRGAALATCSSWCRTPSTASSASRALGAQDAGVVGDLVVVDVVDVDRPRPLEHVLGDQDRVEVAQRAVGDAAQQGGLPVAFAAGLDVASDGAPGLEPVAGQLGDRPRESPGSGRLGT